MSATLEDLEKFYAANGRQSRSIFDVWEHGDARGDSVTPSTYSAEYRTMMMDLLLGELASNDSKRLLSLGCGNAVIEARIADLGHEVLAVDAMPEAVELARKKGLTALQADVETWSPEPGGWPVVYADGLLGHLYDIETGSLPVLARIRDWLAGGGTLIASNDAPKNGAATEAAPGVNAFHWLAEEYLVEQARAAGFSSATSLGFDYDRPLSGARHRSVLIARVDV